MKFFRRHLRSKPGISLVEVLVSTTLFVIILLSMTEIFKMILDSQRQAIATQNVQENIKYFFEVISKEIRMAKRAGGGCSHLPAQKRFATSSNLYGDILYLKNYHDECVKYYLSEDNGVVRFTVDRGTDFGFLSPSKIAIDDLHFLVHEENGSQAYISINLSAHSVGREENFSNMRVQTTISSRYYRN
jgi:type II secretory pathway pseudopilin PulG